MCTNLDNPTAPGGGFVLAQLSSAAFIKWMGECGYKEVDQSNPGQVVVMLYKGSVTHVNNTVFTPNWHITAMMDRLGTRCNNFHFKIESTKATAHYWHYVLHRDAGNGKWCWVGDPNPNLPARNDAGGGAAGNLQELLGNRTLVDVQSRVYGLENKVTRKTQAAMIKKMNQITTWFQFQNGVWTV